MARCSLPYLLLCLVFAGAGCPEFRDQMGDDDTSGDDDATGDDDSQEDDDSDDDSGDDDSGDDDSGDDDTSASDADGDGFTSDEDCDDTDPTVHPGADEGCDGIDTDCDGALGPAEVDDDGDGWSECDGDCDDDDAALHPDRAEQCNGIDDDCDGVVDDGCVVCSVNVPQDHALIGDAIGAAVSGDVICVEPGTYFENLDYDGKDVHVLGIDGQDSTIIDGSGLSSVVDFHSQESTGAILEGFSLLHGYAAEGGGIHLRDASPTLRQLTIAENEAWAGGGVFTADALLSMTGVTITSNTAVEGGGLWATDSELELVSTAVLANVATDGPAGIRVVGGAVAMLDASISDNTTSLESGGASFEDVSSVTLDSVTVTGNSGIAPAVYVLDTAIAMTGCLLSSNQGGGLWVGQFDFDAHYSVSVQGTTISDNSGGAGLACYYSAPSVTEAVISDNTGQGGGGIHVEHDMGTSALEMSDTLIVDNHADTGGGLDFRGHEASLVRVSFQGNQTSLGGDGGGVYFDGAPWPSDVSVFDSVIFDGNQAPGAAGGGGIFVAGGQLDISNALFTTNQSGSSGGGGIAVEDGTVNLANVALAGNSTSNQGGGLFIGGGSVELEQVVLADNAAADGGGIAMISSTPVLTNIIISSNAATNAGGGIYSAGSYPTIEYCDVWGNTPDDYAGMADYTGIAGNVSVSPDFLDTSSPDPMSWDLHLATTSTLIDAGAPSLLDPDGSTSDAGIYGGARAGLFDLDWDGYHEWWLPGPYDAGTSPGNDCDDQDDTIYPGNGC